VDEKREMRILIIILLFASCNPVKKVLRSQEATEQVVREYVKANPPKNDTTFIRGKDSVIERVELDTIPLPYPVKERYVERHYKEVTRVDTSKIKDKELLDALNKRLTVVENLLVQMTTERDYWRKEARTRLYFLLGIVGLLVAALAFRVAKMFKWL
jgi:hypothetical protein